MLRRNINPYEKFQTSATGKFIIIGDIGIGATVDCRGCELEIHGDRDDDVTIHSMGKPVITGSKGRNVTYFTYDASGRCKMSKIGIEGDLVVGQGGYCSISTSAFSYTPPTYHQVTAVSAQPAAERMHVTNSANRYGTFSQNSYQAIPQAEEAVEQNKSCLIL